MEGTITEEKLEGDIIYSNFTHEFKMNEEDMKISGKFHQHAAWNFCGYIWWDNDTNTFHEEIWVYNFMKDRLSSLSLKSLIEEANRLYGWG